MLRIVCFKTHPAITDAWTRAAAKFDLSWAKVDYVENTDDGKNVFRSSLKDSECEYTMMIHDKHMFTNQMYSSICKPFEYSNDILFIGNTNNRFDTWFGTIKDPQSLSGVIFKTSTLRDILLYHSDHWFRFNDDEDVLQYNREYPRCINTIDCLTYIWCFEPYTSLDEKFKLKQIRIDNWLYTNCNSITLEEFEWEFKK